MSDHEKLARFLYDRQADSYNADPEMREELWTGGVRDFWLAEAAAILNHLENVA